MPIQKKDECTITTSTTGTVATSPTNQPTVTDLGLQGGHRRLYKLLRDFHGFKKEQCVTLRDQGYMTLSDLVD